MKLKPTERLALPRGMTPGSLQNLLLSLLSHIGNQRCSGEDSHPDQSV